MSEALFQAGDVVETIFGDEVTIRTDVPSGRLYVGGFGPVFNSDGTNETYKYPPFWHKATGHGPVTGERPKWVPTGPCYARCWDFNKCNADECLIQGYDSNNPEEPYRIAPDVGYAYAEPCEAPAWANLWPRGE